MLCGVVELMNIFFLKLESCLGKRSRVENRVSQDYSHCDDLTALESTSPAQEYYERYSESINFTIPTTMKEEASSATNSIDSTYSFPINNIQSNNTVLQKNATAAVTNQNIPQKNIVETSLPKKSSFLKDSWGWFVSGGEDDTFS